MAREYDQFAEKPVDEEEPDVESGPVDAGDPAAHRKRLTKAAVRDRDIRRFWARIFDDPIGRAEMWNILREAGTFDDRFGVGPSGFPQPEQSWFHMGQRSLGLRLYQSWLALAREGVCLMQDEHDPRFARPKMPKTKKAE